MVLYQFFCNFVNDYRLHLWSSFPNLASIAHCLKINSTGVPSWKLEMNVLLMQSSITASVNTLLIVQVFVIYPVPHSTPLYG